MEVEALQPLVAGRPRAVRTVSVLSRTAGVEVRQHFLQRRYQVRDHRRGHLLEVLDRLDADGMVLVAKGLGECGGRGFRHRAELAENLGRLEPGGGNRILEQRDQGRNHGLARRPHLPEDLGGLRADVEVFVLQHFDQRDSGLVGGLGGDPTQDLEASRSGHSGPRILEESGQGGIAAFDSGPSCPEERDDLDAEVDVVRLDRLNECGDGFLGEGAELPENLNRLCAWVAVYCDRQGNEVRDGLVGGSTQPRENLKDLILRIQVAGLEGLEQRRDSLLVVRPDPLKDLPGLVGEVAHPAEVAPHTAISEHPNDDRDGLVGRTEIPKALRRSESGGWILLVEVPHGAPITPRVFPSGPVRPSTWAAITRTTGSFPFSSLAQGWGHLGRLGTESLQVCPANCWILDSRSDSCSTRAGRLSLAGGESRASASAALSRT